jgi:hypothetical protein
VDFRADKDFPTDDSGYGFDNIADILTDFAGADGKVPGCGGGHRLARHGRRSAAQEAARSHHTRKTKPSAAWTTAPWKPAARGFRRRLQHPLRLPGQRAADAKPVKLGFWMDGQLLNTMEVETKPSKLVYFDPYSEAKMRLYLPEGDHVFRAGFIDDDFVKTCPIKEAYDNKKNKFNRSITFVGPFPSEGGAGQPQEDSDLRSRRPGRRAWRRSSPTLARHRAYRGR